DIEGTTSSISFVHEVMFPYVLEHLEPFLNEHWHSDEVRAACEQIARDAGHSSLAIWTDQQAAAAPTARTDQAEGAEQTEREPAMRALVCQEVRRLMAGDVKATGLKALQGLIWRGGFDSGQLLSDVYADVLPAIRQWRQAGIDVRIYSSGSIA